MNDERPKWVDEFIDALLYALQRGANGAATYQQYQAAAWAAEIVGVLSRRLRDTDAHDSP